ncbi:uncharacterized protein N7459_001661 [Penicillium hispanicum]|uniref:uncharacterized protein n=1 Tax=Penicillium hispanicum TaxID=1080232 RepID=UPI00254148E7|nr:uncharacterized protein N7459_001661 [Penicillium hispanicum]KAJ5595453.1 hypothetical protein N7459_001661 [Penicillium hispanicum]
MPDSHRIESTLSKTRERTVAPYGQACIHCARAKCKCILFGPEDRCARLDKDCRPAPTVRKHTKSSTASRIAHLESKLDSLLSVLQNTGVISQSTVDSGIASESENSAPGEPRGLGTGIRPDNEDVPLLQPSLVGRYPHLDPDASLPLSSEKADELLRKFRSENLSYLPFIHLPSHITPQDLAREKPFFWKCITIALTPNLKERESLFTTVHDTIHQKVLVEVAPSMDILLGVMTFMSWKMYSKKSFLNFYSHILMGLVCDLGLNKAAFKEQPLLPRFQRTAGLDTRDFTRRTLEEQRALLGCFLITSSIASSTYKGDALRWTPHMDRSVQALADANACLQDEMLVSLVKIQLVVDKVYHLRRDEEDCKLSPLVIELLQAQLSLARSQIPMRLKENQVIRMYLANADLMIHETSLKVPIISDSPDAQDLQSLYSSLQAAKSCLNVWITVPPEHYMGVSFTIFQFCRALMNLYKLSTLDSPGWDRNAVRNAANILHYLDHLQANFKRASEHLDQEADANMFVAAVRMMTTIKQRWEPILMESWYPAMPVSEVTNGVDADNGIEKHDAFQLDYVDDTWMMDFLGGF